LWRPLGQPAARRQPPAGFPTPPGRSTASARRPSWAAAANSASVMVTCSGRTSSASVGRVSCVAWACGGPLLVEQLGRCRHLPHGRHQAGTATSSSTKPGTTSVITLASCSARRRYCLRDACRNSLPRTSPPVPHALLLSAPASSTACTGWLPPRRSTLDPKFVPGTAVRRGPADGGLSPCRCLITAMASLLGSVIPGELSWLLSTRGVWSAELPDGAAAVGRRAAVGNARAPAMQSVAGCVHHSVFTRSVDVRSSGVQPSSPAVRCPVI
jgi:hypothetical protein